MSIKKLSAGAWITCLAAVAALAALIVYSINIASTGYFQARSVNNLVLFSILAIVLLVLAIVLRQAEAKGAAGAFLQIVAGAAQIGAVALLAVGTISLIASRVEGLGFIYFSNADVIKEVQTPANLASGSAAIVSMVLYGVAMLLAIFGAFSGLRKAEKKEEKAEEK